MKILLLVLCVLLQSCKTALPNGNNQSSLMDSSTWGQRPVQPKMCAAVRGNGNYIFAHWGAMARVIEEFGPFEGFAGGSSASITGFIYENIYRNPSIWQCDGGSRSCSREESSLRLSLMLKSIAVYLDQFKATSGLQSELSGRNKVILGLKIRRIKKAIEEQRFINAAEDAQSILAKPELGAIINPSFIEHINNSLGSEQQAALAVKDVLGAVDALQWKIEDSTAFFRKGLIDFGNLGSKIGVLADFFAGIEGSSLEDMRVFLDGCAENSRGKEILEVLQDQAKFNSPSQNNVNATCFDLIGKATSGHFERVLKDVEVEERTFKVISYVSKSIDEPVGKYLPVIATNSFFTEKNGIKAFAAAQANFNKNREPPKIGFELDWLKFGYYGQQQDLTRIVAGASKRSDLKSRKAASLGVRTWREVLRLSPLEPGLSSAQCLINEGSISKMGEWQYLPDVKDFSQCKMISTGGWSDLEPVDILKDIGCEKVVMIHRAGPATKFAQRMISFMSKNEMQYQIANKELYDLANVESSYSRSLSLANGVMCTNWDQVPKGDPSCLIKHGFNSKILTTDPILLKSMLNKNSAGFDAIVDSESKVYGCSAGAKVETPLPIINCPELEEQ